MCFSLAAGIKRLTANCIQRNDEEQTIADNRPVTYCGFIKRTDKNSDTSNMPVVWDFLSLRKFLWQ
jgi:hypothetical protein